MNLVLKSCLAALLLTTGGPALADLYGFVDENGVAHLSNVPLNDRYYLFKKESPVTPPPESDAVITQAPTMLSNPAYRKHYAPLVTAVAKEYRLDSALLHAVVTVESGYNPKAKSPKGALGLMQLMPDTAERYAVRNIWDPSENLRGGAKYLRDLLALFNNDLSLALAAYNAGEAAVIQAGNKIPPIAETRSYVPRVLLHYERYRSANRR